MKNIIVPIDFSEASICAAKYAASFCRFTGGEVHLLNVFHLPNPIRTLPIELIVTMDEIAESTHSQLKTIKEVLEKDNPNCPAIHLASRNGNTIDEINAFGRFINGDLIIAGSKINNKGILGMRGSILNALARQVELPLLIIPEGFGFNPPETIVFAIDGKDHPKNNGLRQVQEIASAFNAKIVIEHIGSEINPIVKNRIIEQQEPVFSNTTHSYQFEENSDVTGKLKEISLSERTGLLVMIQNKHDFIERFSGYDRTQIITASTKIPLMILHDDNSTD